MIRTFGFKYDKFNFPCGETHIVLRDCECIDEEVSIHFVYEENAEIIELLLLADTLKMNGISIRHLTIPYVPYSRQDRVNKQGECLSIKTFCGLINQIGAKSVTIYDPHSDITTALINNVDVLTQADIFVPQLYHKQDYYLISPDAGAAKKIYKIAAKVKPIGVVEFSKVRNTETGEISGVSTACHWFNGKECVIVDDICDGGRTFIEIAEVLKRRGAGKITLMVTHGFFTKGIEVFDGLIDEIYTRKGKVK